MIQIDLGQKSSWTLDQEWLVTDGRGGYASSTLTDCHTRSYHGMLVANLAAPEGRHCLLSKWEDSFRVAGRETFFTSHRYPGSFFPPEPPPLKSFALDLLPRFFYQAAGVTMEKSLLFAADGALLVRYHLESAPGEGALCLKPFLAFRGFHRLSRENDHLCPETESGGQGFRIAPYEGMPSLLITASRPCRFSPASLWYRNFEYQVERDRGFDCCEDLFLPGVLEIPMEPGGSLLIRCATIPQTETPEASWESGLARLQEQRQQDERFAASVFSPEATGASRLKAAPAPLPGPPEGCRGTKGRSSDPLNQDLELLLTLIQAGHRFLITTPSGRSSLIAGYHWFESWGRDTLLSLPGLTFHCGRLETGIAILSEISRHEKEGLLPNFFSSDGAADAYNSVDSSLFYFWAVQEFLQVTDDASLVRERFWPVMKRIIARFQEGTRFGIAMDRRGLLQAGDGRHALTWMDATVNEIPVTPRQGFPVDINALWYNALCLARDLGARFSDPERPSGNLLDSCRRAFQQTFWVPATGCLGDCWYNGKLDEAIRPNQLFAVSLPFSPLTPDKQAGVVRTVREHLLTPCGLRTLSPSDPAYRRRYEGSGPERDAAYHQGTVWPWLWGPYGDASLRVAEDQESEKANLLHQLRSFLGVHLREAGIGSVSEVFDGDPPHRPGGCIAQAWSVAELIRLYTKLLAR
ncbi:MAG: amylo-alpha-1,6-glucosidase [Syntrophaceae bacterium]|nr:amylo-alpha-1,6-glucosidase [Syntrophaceae bacterium]